MRRILVLGAIIVFAALCASPATVGRAADLSNSEIVHLAIHAVVNVSVWRMRPGLTAADPQHRVKTTATGFIIDPAGIIVTNKRAITDAIDIMVTVDDGTKAHGTLIAAAQMADLALIKVDFARSFPVLKWGDSDQVRVGDPVVTIGNPLGLGVSVSMGVVSALNRDLQDTPFDSYIQTDAKINNGNAGGPLLNRRAEVIGINTVHHNPDSDGGAMGIGFSIPSAAAQFVVNRLLDPHHPRPGWLGLKLQDVTPGLAEAFGLPSRSGAVVAEVHSDGPASRASLRPGDVLLGINGDSPRDSRAFMRAIVRTAVGQQVVLIVWREGHAQQVMATIAEWPNAIQSAGVIDLARAKALMKAPPDLGLTLEPMTDAARRRFGLSPTIRGVLITAVEGDCEAGELGLSAGDVITMVQGLSVSRPGEVRRALEEAHQRRRSFIALLVQSRKARRWVALSVADTDK